MTLADADLNRDDIQFDSRLVKSTKQKRNTVNTRVSRGYSNFLTFILRVYFREDLL